MLVFCKLQSIAQYILLLPPQYFLTYPPKKLLSPTISLKFRALEFLPFWIFAAWIFHPWTLVHYFLHLYLPSLFISKYPFLRTPLITASSSQELPILWNPTEFNDHGTHLVHAHYPELWAYVSVDSCLPNETFWEEDSWPIFFALWHLVYYPNA